MKKILAIIFAVMMAVSVAACRENSDGTASGGSEMASAQVRTVTDLLGREVAIPEQINRVAAINSAARMLTYAGAADKLVGCTDMDKEAQAGMPYTYVNADRFSSLASVGSGGSSDTVYTEELVTLAPDLIFAFTTDTELLDEVQAQTGIPVVGLYAKEIFDESFYQTLELAGSIMGTEEHCAQIVSSMKEWQQDLQDRTRDIPEEEKPSVYSGAVSFKGGHGFEGTYGAYPPFVAVNANNVVDSTGKTGSMLIDLEKVTVWDPDIIFLNPLNMNLVNEDYEKNAAFYDNLTAVKEGRVYTQVAFNYNSCNMEIAMADAYYAGTVIYPEAFSDVDFEEKAEEIFRVMLGQDYLKVLEEAGIGFGELTIGK